MPLTSEFVGNRSMVGLFLTAAAGGAALFFAVLTLGAALLPREGLEWLLYIVAATAIPPFAYLYAFGVARASRNKANSQEFQTLSALFIGVVLCAVTMVLRIGLVRAPTSISAALLAVGAFLLVLVVLLLGALVPVSAVVPNGAGSRRRWAKALEIVGVVALASTIFLFMQRPAATGGFWATFVAFLVVALCLGAGEASFRIFPRRTFDAIVLAGLALALISMGPPIDKHHHDFYLGSVNDVLRGKLLLVDSFSQYGVLVMHFLAVMIAPFGLSYSSLGALVTFFLFVQVGIIYVLLRLLLRSRLVPLGFTLLIVLVNVYGQINYPSAYPSVGPLRFLPPYFLLLAVLLRERWPKYLKWLMAAELLLVALTSLWSFETFVYTVATYTGIVLFEAAGSRRPRAHLMRIFAAAGGVITLQALFATGTFLASGTWPRWGIYLSLLRLYSVQGFGSLPIDPWSPWALVASIYFLSILALISLATRAGSGEKSRRQLELSVVSGLTAMGIANFSYFVGRSHPNNLRHICIPAVMLTAYWLVKARAQKGGQSRSFAWGAIVVCAMLIALFAFNDARSISQKWRLSLIGSLWPPANGGRGAVNTLSLSDQWASIRHPRASDVRVEEAEWLIRRYAREDRLIPILMNPDLLTETLFRARKANVFPLSDPIQDQLITGFAGRPDRFSGRLRQGQWLFMQPTELNQVEKFYLAKVKRSFDLQQGEVTPHGVAAYRLVVKK
ncbi:MAG: hypothetical protein ACR2FO_05335 [Actinomycetota bacterium]